MCCASYTRCLNNFLANVFVGFFVGFFAHFCADLIRFFLSRRQ